MTIRQMASSAELDITVCLSRWRPYFFEIHHDHEVNIIYGGFGGMCTRCIRRSHWSLNSARVHRPVNVPHSGFVRTLASLLCSLKIVWNGYHYGEVSEVGDYVCTA